MEFIAFKFLLDIYSFWSKWTLCKRLTRIHKSQEEGEIISWRNTVGKLGVLTSNLGSLDN